MLPFSTSLLMFAASVLVFAVFPELDLQVAAWFYEPDTGFHWRGLPPVLASYELFKARRVSWVLIALLAYVIYAFISRKPSLARRNAAFFLLVMIVVGPILLVNTGLKDHWGRARPSQVMQFGGDRLYTPPLHPAAQCDRNCSFVSGHAAAGFALIGLYWTTRRRRWLIAGIALGSLVGLGRMIQGGHFFSDIVFSFWAVYFSSAVLASLMLRPPRNTGTDASSGAPNQAAH
jgi:lipid A 4'-phosphatase